MMIYIGLDDTDTIESRGTGHLAREIAAHLAQNYSVAGVIRHQLFQDPRVPFTSHNSCAVILLEAPSNTDLYNLEKQIRKIMLEDFQPGSDPGLCLAKTVDTEVTAFGLRAQKELVTQLEARELAQKYGIILNGLGGTEDGVIGALAGVGLAAYGNDGRYILVGRTRELSGLQSVETILNTGVSAIQTLEGEPVTEGLISADKLRPARRDGKPIAYVEWNQDYWQPLKLDY